MRIPLPAEEGGGFTMAGRYLHDLQIIRTDWRILLTGAMRDYSRCWERNQRRRVPSIRNSSPLTVLITTELYGSGWLAGAHAIFRYKNYLFVGDEVFPGGFEAGFARNRIPVPRHCALAGRERPRSPAGESRPTACPKGGFAQHLGCGRTCSIWATTCGWGASAGRFRGTVRGELYNQGREIAAFLER